MREDLDEAEAYMVLATANAQGELSPLEIGMHALHYVEKGQGKKGGGLSAYAEAIGRNKQNVGAYRDAARVLSTCNIDITSLIDPETRKPRAIAAHLAAIHKLPEEAWSVAVEAMLAGEWSAKETGEKARIAEAAKARARNENGTLAETPPAEEQPSAEPSPAGTWANLVSLLASILDGWLPRPFAHAYRRVGEWAKRSLLRLGRILGEL